MKLKSRLSVRLSDRPADISAVSAWIDVGLAQNESCVLESCSMFVLDYGMHSML